jgi:divalent metal cation (Fe/Co/Zn/Cd) transporter
MEGVLILAGSAVIAFAAIRALIEVQLDHLGVGIVVVGFAAVVNLAVSSWLFRKAARCRAPR